MQSGRNFPADRGRGLYPATDGGIERRKQPVKVIDWPSPAKARDVKTASSATLQEETRADRQGKVMRKTATTTAAAGAGNRAKAKVAPPGKADDGRGNYSVKKLLSAYETLKDGETVSVRQDKPQERTKDHAWEPKPATKVTKSLPARGESPPLSEKGASKRLPLAQENKLRDSKVEFKESVLPTLRGGRKPVDDKPKGLRRPLQRNKITPESSAMRVGESGAPGESAGNPKAEEEASSAPEPNWRLLPVPAAEKKTETPAGLISSLLTQCLDSDPQAKFRVDMPFTQSDNEKESAYPVCGKKAKDEPPPDVAGSDPGARNGLTPDERDIVIMLRRRNSDRPSNCVLRCEATSSSLSVGSQFWSFGCNPVENYLRETGQGRPCKPFWEVSLFRTNRSADDLVSGQLAHLMPITPLTGNQLPNDHDIRRRIAEEKPPQSTESPSVENSPPPGVPCKPERVAEAEPAAAKCNKPVDEVKTEANSEEAPPPAAPETPQPRAHLLIYVKPSQRRFVTNDTQSDAGVNRKVHRITKVTRVTSEFRSTAWHRHIIFTVASALVLITGGFFFMVYCLVNHSGVFNLTPPVPGLVRGN